MGQQVSVTALASRPGILRFEANRNFTGMGHENFASLTEARGDRPAAVVARRLLETGKVDGVHVYGNIISIDLARGSNGDGLDQVVANMYQYWTPGRDLPSFDAPADEAPAAGGGDAGGGGGAGAGPSQYELRVPELLRQRSAAALQRLKPNG